MADDKTPACDSSVTALMARVGERVRAARGRKGLPRRVLSERSGVSPRYLAQLESGDGNISIGLLQKVASALDCRIEALIGEAAPPGTEARRIATLFDTAPRDVQRHILRLLESQTVTPQRAGRICLIGLRGAGKSTLGRMAGTALNLPFLELTAEIRAQSGMPVDEVIALYGQEGYRKLEAQALSHVARSHDRIVLAASGGIVEAPETFEMLLERFHTIWIRTSPGEHMSRVRAQGDERPMAGNPEAMAQLKAILTSRQPQYARAGAQLDTSAKPVGASLSALLRIIAKNHYLD